MPEETHHDVVDATRRTLIGHSNGALFACYAALRSRPGESPLFSTVVSADGGAAATRAALAATADRITPRCMGRRLPHAN